MSFRSTKRTPCPICESVDGACLIRDDVVLCMHGTPGYTPSDRDFFTRESFILDAGMGYLWRRLSTMPGRNNSGGFFPKAPRPTRRGKDVVRTKSTVDIDAIFKAVVYKSLPPAFYSEWRESGKYTLELADYGVRQISVEGAELLIKHGLTHFKSPHTMAMLELLFCPLFGPDGTIVGAQLRNKPSHSGNRYVWCSGEQTSFRNAHGEVPLSYLPCDRKSNTLIFVEGALKSIKVHSIVGQFASIIGGVGGQWAYSPETLKELVLLAKAEGVTNFLLAGDAGWANNQSTMTQYRALFDVLLPLGVKLKHLDWEQASEKEKGDIDDLSCTRILDTIEACTGSRPSLGGEFSQLIASGLEAAKEYKSFGSGRSDLHNPTQEQFLEAVRTHKVVIDARPTGYGKTHNIENLVNGLEDTRIVVLSKSPRNPTTKFLEDNAHIAVTRYVGTIDLTTKLPSGKPQTKTVEAGKVYDNPGTCSRVSSHVQARALGIESKDVCTACPLFNACSQGSDPENNYLFKLKVENLGEKNLIATSVKAFSPRLLSETKQNLIFVDEWSDIVPPNLKTEVSFGNFATFQSLAQSFNIELGVSNPDSFGRSFFTLEESKELEDACFAADEVSRKAAIARLKAGKAPGWITNNLGIYHAMREGAFYRSREGFFTNQKNPMINRLLHSADKLVISDATISYEEVQALGISDFIYISADNLATENLDIEVLRAEGFSTYRWDKNSSAVRVEQALREKLPSAAFAVPCHSRRPGDVGFFSDSRGSNAFQNASHLVVVGAPLPNLGAVREAYESFQEPAFTLEDYYAKRTMDELVQTMGRLRASRRQGESLRVSLVSNSKLTCLENMGFRVSYQLAADVVSEAHTPATKSLSGLLECVFGGAKSVAEIAQQTGRKTQSIYRTLNSAAVKITTLVKARTASFCESLVWADLPVEVVQELVQWDGETELSPELFQAASSTIFTTGARGTTLKAWREFKVRFITYCLKRQLVLSTVGILQQRHTNLDFDRWYIGLDL